MPPTTSHQDAKVCEDCANGPCIPIPAQGFQQQQRLQSLGLMVGEIAHDLNNTFAMALGQAELLEEDLRLRNEPIPNHLHNMLHSLHSGSDLCRSMLAFAGKTPPSSMTCDPVYCINQIQELFRIAIPPMATFTCDLAPSTPFIHANPGQVQQIVMNLLMNASEALQGKSGYIHLRASTRTIAEGENSQDLSPGQYVSISVSDNGCGMDDQTQAKLFNPFFTTKLTGKGLGLTSVAHLVHALGGDLQVESTLGEGSTFTVLLPASDQQPDASAPASMHPDHAQKSSPSLSGTIMFVEDEEHLCKISAEILERTGAKVLTAYSGQEAIECFRAHAQEIDLVLLDAIMPDMHGCDVYKTIHSMKPDTHVVIVSGYAASDLQDLLGDLTPSALILKPVSMVQLQETAARFLPLKKDTCA